jgi:hypothetical protein
VKFGCVVVINSQEENSCIASQVDGAGIVIIISNSTSSISIGVCEQFFKGFGQSFGTVLTNTEWFNWCFTRIFVYGVHNACRGES